jgi:aryl-alcohol dehydrogenase-like predicted oxidoreductase
MTFGEDWGWGSTKEESRRVFDTYAEAGGNFLDTANVYTNGTSEKLLGEFVASERPRFVIATKYTGSQRADDPNAGGNQRKNMVQSVELSLRRLGTDYIDLLWVHAWDQLTPAEETMRALDDLVRAGKVLYVGVSDFPAWLVSRANTLAELKGWSPFIALQIEYSLIERTPERELLPMAEALGLTVTPWSPLSGGILTGKYGKKSNEQKRMDKAAFRPLSERNLRIASAVEDIAGEIGCPPSQVALAWLRGRGDMIPILGARTRQQLVDNMGCLGVRLSAPQCRSLDEVSAVDLGFPTDFLKKPFVRQFIHGQTWERIDRRESALASRKAEAEVGQEMKAR